MAKKVNTSDYSPKELNTILSRLDRELQLAVTREEKTEIKRSIQFFTQEQRNIA